MIRADLVFNNVVVTNEQLNQQISLLRQSFIELHITEEDIVAIFLPNSIALIESIGASMLYGNNYCPVNFRLTPSEVSYLLLDSKARVLITNNEGYDKIRTIIPSGLIVILADETRSETGHSHHYYKLDKTLAGEQSHQPDGCLGTHMPYTSGTTGKPKGILRKKKKWRDVTATVPVFVSRALGIEVGGVALMSAPLHHSATNTFVQNALLYGDMLVLMEKFDAETVLQIIDKYKVTTAYLVPTMYKRMLDLSPTIRQAYDASSLKFVASTGSACPRQIKQEMIQWLGPIIHECYASSETGFVTLLSSEDALSKPGSVGTALGDAELRIRADGAWAGPGVNGLIYARQPAYPDFTYQNNNEARQSIECEGLITVGDIGYLDEDGYLYVTDRQSDMVISGGVNIYPAEIEQLIHQHKDIEDNAVFGIPDQEFGESLICLLQLKPGRVLDKAAFMQFLKRNLAGYKIPKKIGLIDKLPREETGKLFKKKLQNSIDDVSVTFL